jgi:hypothetical protein
MVSFHTNGIATGVGLIPTELLQAKAAGAKWYPEKQLWFVITWQSGRQLTGKAYTYT